MLCSGRRSRTSHDKLDTGNANTGEVQLASAEAQLEKHIEQGDGLNSLAWRYGVTTGAIERALKQLGLETFDQRYQRLTARKKKKGSTRTA